MGVSNISQEATIPRIGRYYGKTWIEIHKCTNSSKPLTRQGMIIKYGIRLR